MNERPDDASRLRHMLAAATWAIEATDAVSRDDLDGDLTLVLALLKSIEIVGEAASRVSDHGRARYDRIPWPDAIRTRNRLVHGYFDINLDILWTTVRQDLPELVMILRRYLDAQTG